MIYIISIAYIGSNKEIMIYHLDDKLWYNNECELMLNMKANQSLGAVNDQGFVTV
jgi:hypothetical protein